MEKLKISNDESEVTLQLKDLKQMGSFIITKNQVLFLTTDDFNKMNTHQRIGLSEIMKKLIEADLENHLKKHGYEEQKSEENWWDYYSYEDSGELEYRIPNYKIERFKNKVRELNAELNSYLKELLALKKDSEKIHNDFCEAKKYWTNTNNENSERIYKAEKLISLIIMQQSRFKGIPMAGEWNAIVKEFKEYSTMYINPPIPKMELNDSPNTFGSQNEGGNPL